MSVDHWSAALFVWANCQMSAANWLMILKRYDLKHTANLIADRVQLFSRDSANAVTEKMVCFGAIQHFGQ